MRGLAEAIDAFIDFGMTAIIRTAAFLLVCAFFGGIVPGLAALLSGCDDRPCVRSHTEQAWFSTGVAGFFADIQVCDEYAPEAP
ncbi:hypothetical protein K2Z84_05315 [Candidatus Binatia bacterium]|nr:hypothetical protein [Candidatus Binatia bacterium]